MGYAHGFRWSDELVESELRPIGRKMGRMPSSTELRDMGRNSLACAISRSGGYYRWSQRLGLEQKGTETHWAQKWERHEVEFFSALGFGVQRQSTKSKFDLLVQGQRVDVKAARWTPFRKGGKFGSFVFAGLKWGAGCDVFDLLCIEGEAVKHRYLIPADKARVTTLSISRRSLGDDGKYSAFRDASPLEVFVR